MMLCLQNESESKSYSVVFDSSRTHGPHGPHVTPWNSPDQNTRVGSLDFLQGIFPTQGSNRGLLNWGSFFTNWAIREAPYYSLLFHINHFFGLFKFFPKFSTILISYSSCLRLWFNLTCQICTKHLLRTKHCAGKNECDIIPVQQSSWSSRKVRDI